MPRVSKPCIRLFLLQVKGVAEDDLLNIREKPDYGSQKVGTQLPNALMGVERCVDVKTSVWCKVYQLVQNFYSEDFSPGWVNADYLKPENRGYVLIDTVRNCDYALGCHEGVCEIVIDYDTDALHNVTALKRRMFKRNKLRGESNFGAISQEVDGMCNSRNFIEDYLQKE